MKRNWIIIANICALLFGIGGIVSQLSDTGKRYGIASVVGSATRSRLLSNLTNIVERDKPKYLAAGADRYLDLVLPKDARVFMTGMTGATNFSKSGNYYFLTYYLFPREVSVSIGQPVHITKDGMQGRTSESDEEILANGYDVRVDLDSTSTLHPRMLRDLQLNKVVNPDWFDSPVDEILAFLLPLFTAFTGLWALRFLFPSLNKELRTFEQLACGFGLGMMMVAALTLGVKLCGFHGHHLIFVLTGTATIMELRRIKTTRRGITEYIERAIQRPITLILLGGGLLVFLILFRVAGLQGIMEFDAVAFWMLKAKILFLYTGNEIINWFSNPRLAYAHLDYPLLMPSLHASTLDSIGHMNDFVTKFWPTWMLLFLFAALASIECVRERRFQPYHFFLLGLLLLPATQKYAQMEGGTMPMVFFAVTGYVQCAIGLLKKNGARVGLGLTFLFGAALTKFEGSIFLAVAIFWVLARPSLRPLLKLSKRGLWVLAFCVLMALPFVYLRMKIPVLHFESNWMDYGLANPAVTISSVPKIFAVIIARSFVSQNLASWNAEGDHLYWSGKWDGISSLQNHLTLELPWFCLLITIITWITFPSRRHIVMWLLAVLFSIVLILSGVFACFVCVTGLNPVIFDRTDDVQAGRYLFPILMTWAAVATTLFFGKFVPGDEADTPESKTI